LPRDTPAPTLTSLRLALTNDSSKRSGTLLTFIDRATQATVGKGAQRHVYVLTCYFDIDALVEVIATVFRRINSVSGKIAGVTVAIDVGEWIRCRVSSDELIGRIAKAARVPEKLVKVISVRVPGHLLHAKAYAAIKPLSQEKGFVVITSGNTTRRGLGLSEACNLEIAALITERESLVEFEGIMRELAKHQISEQLAMKQDEFLQALALFSSGFFYHRWQGSLGAEMRFTLALTSKGKKARSENASQFREYQPDGDTMSRSPIDIENVFRKNPRPFSAAFWRNYAVDTLLGYWIPRPVAEIVDQKLAQDVKPYLDEVRKLTTPTRVTSVVSELKNDLKDFRRRGWVKEKPTVIDGWQDRVTRFRHNADLIKLRIHPYQRVPEVLTSETRQAILETAAVLREHLHYRKRLMPTKSVVAEFFAGRLTVAELDHEWSRVGRTASEGI
jgi:hypothetical protein